MPGERILVVDDEATIRDVLQRVLSAGGYEVLTAATGSDALDYVFRDNIGLVLLDIKMPGMSGIEVFRKLIVGHGDTCVVMVTAVDETTTAVEMMKLGAYDYLIKPFDREEVLITVNRALEKRRLELENEEYKHNLERKVREQAAKIRASFFNAMTSLAYALEAKDKYTAGHSQRVADISVAIAEALGMAGGEISKLRMAARVHDIGKIGIIESILNKPARLTREEIQLVQSHPVIGERILSPVSDDIGFLKLVRAHHEHFDGTGYPDRLRGDAIPLGARVMAVADSYDAMTSERPYRKAMSDADARIELTKGEEAQFDPSKVRVFLETVRNQEGLSRHEPASHIGG